MEKRTTPSAVQDWLNDASWKLTNAYRFADGQTQKNRQPIGKAVFMLVAGVGFEPTTFRL